MQRDLKEIVGILMRILDGGEVARDEVIELGFEADGALQVVLNEAYIKLLEFAHDAEMRRSNADADHAAREELRGCLARIMEAYDRQSGQEEFGRRLG